MDINSVVITGNLVRDITVRPISYGEGANKVDTKVVNFAIGCDYRQNKVVYPNCSAFGSNAEFMEKYLNTKGAKVAIQGHLADDSWTDANGQKQYRTSIVVDRIIPFSAAANESPWA